MDEGPTDQSRPLKKRRTPKACASCRRSKLGCDEKRPCSRCMNAKVDCIYLERPVDPNLARIEKLESEVYNLNQRLNGSSNHERGHNVLSTTSHLIGSVEHDASSAATRTSLTSSATTPGTTVTSSAQSSAAYNTFGGGLVGFLLREPSTVNVVACGLITEDDARRCYSVFFEGCVWFVSIFDRSADNYTSIRSRSSILFDTLVIIGARAIHGVFSKDYQTLHHLLRQHTSDLILRISAARSNITVEDVQALLVIAAYSDSGAVLCDVALRACLKLGLDKQADEHLASMSGAPRQQRVETGHSSVRIWYYLFVLDMILSIDGGKPPTLTIQPAAARRVRMFVGNAHCDAPDTRLFAQVELNAIRCAAHECITTYGNRFGQEPIIDRTLRGAVLDLDLWLSEWQNLVSSLHFTTSQQTSVLLNLRIQHAWAALVLHLRTLTVSGIDNIAIMTPQQRNVATAAKTFAERHLQLVMTRVQDNVELDHPNSSDLPYVASFKYAMDFVWAKNSFCVLIVLRLSILLGDSVSELMSRLLQAREFLVELNRVNGGTNLSYIRILSQIVEKCEAAVRASMPNENGALVDASANDFQSFVPKEFMFEWDFPGVHLHYIPLDFQDLLFDIGNGT